MRILPRELKNRGLEALDLSTVILMRSNPARGGEGLLQAIAAAHPLDAALGVHTPLLAGVEGVTITTDFNAERRLGGAGVEHETTGAGYRGVIEIWVNICLHFYQAFIYSGFYLLRNISETSDPESGGFLRVDTNPSAALGGPFKLHLAVDGGEDSVIPTEANVSAGLYPGPALPDDYSAAGDALSAIPFDSKPFRIAISAVTGAAASLFMSHQLLPSPA